MKIYNAVLGLVALGIAGCAAYFSVTGLSRLFGGNATQVAIMAGFLEAGKLICASAAYKYKEIAPLWIRSLLIGFTVVMMLITSLGIFGYLSSSYETVASDLQSQNVKVEALGSKKSSFESQITRLEEERGILLQERSSQQQRLNSLSEQYAERGWASDQQAVERVEGQIDELQSEISEVNSEIQAKTDSVFSIEQQVIDVRTQDSDVRNKLGPLLFVSRAFGADMDTAVTWFIGFLIFVFDPMAVVLIVAFNMATGFEKPEEKGLPDDREKSYDEITEELEKDAVADGLEEEPGWEPDYERVVSIDTSEDPFATLQSSGIDKQEKKEETQGVNESVDLDEPMDDEEPIENGSQEETNIYGDKITETDQLDEIMQDLEERDDISEDELDEVLRKYLGDAEKEPEKGNKTTYAAEFKGDKKYKTSPAGGMRIERKDDQPN